MSKHAHTEEKAQGESAPSPAVEENGGAAKSRNRRLGRRDDIVSLALLTSKATAIYQDFYKEIFRASALDRKTKELIAIAASSISGCEGCLVGHVRKARALGASEEEIKESVAVAFAVNAATVVDRTDVAAAVAKRMSEVEAATDSNHRG